MNNKFIALIIIFVISVSFLTGCQKNDIEANAQESEIKSKIVNVEKVSEKSVNDTLNYIGIIKAKDTKNYSFLTGGKIEKIYVSEGEFVKASSPIAKLDTKTLEYSATASSYTTDSANAVLQKTINTYNNQITETENSIRTIKDTISATETSIEALEKQLVAEKSILGAGKSALDAEKKALDASYSSLCTLEDHLNKTILLYDEGVISSYELDTIQTEYDNQKAAYDIQKAEYDVSLADYEGQEAAYEGQKASYETKKTELSGLNTQLETANDTLSTLKSTKEQDIKSAQASILSSEISTSINNKNINDAQLYADFDCYILEVPYKEGETTAAGYPVAIVKSNDKIVTIGVSDKDYLKITPTSNIIINDKYSGTVDSIPQYPDETTRTYNVDILVNTDELVLGETVDVKVVIGNNSGYFVPITSVFNLDGVDYIFAVNNENRVYKKQVNIISINNDYTQIDIDVNDNEEIYVITDEIKNINENDLVSFQK